MNATERFYFDSRTQEILEHITIPFAIYQYEPDRQRFQEQVTAENVLKEIRQHGSFSIDYHLIIKGVPRPVTLKAAMFKDGDEEKVVVGVREWKARKE